MSRNIHRAPRTKLTLDPQLRHQLCRAQALTGDETPFSGFLVRLLKLGLVEFLTQAQAQIRAKRASDAENENELADADGQAVFQAEVDALFHEPDELSDEEAELDAQYQAYLDKQRASNTQD